MRGEVRDAAIIELLLQPGIRLSVLARLKVSDIELPARIDRKHFGAVKIHGKGRKERTVTLNWKACRAVRNRASSRSGALVVDACRSARLDAKTRTGQPDESVRERFNRLGTYRQMGA